MSNNDELILQALNNLLESTEKSLESIREIRNAIKNNTKSENDLRQSAQDSGDDPEQGVKQQPPENQNSGGEQKQNADGHSDKLQNEQHVPESTLKSKSVPADSLGGIPDYRDTDWPVAAPPDQIVSHDESPRKQLRALQIVGNIGVPCNGLRVLDCGCGEGFVAEELTRQASEVVGYDIENHERWKQSDSVRFTTSKEEVNGEFGLIVLYDVLDHLKGESPEQFLKWLHSKLAADGTVFARTHPWTSKHGGHLYYQVNKAYLHLAMTADELAQQGISVDHNLRISRPMAAYEKWFREAGFKFNKNIIAEKVDDYFHGELLNRIMSITWGGKIDKDQALKIMANQFIDYKLTK